MSGDLVECVVERQQRLRKLLPVQILHHHHLEAELLQHIAHPTRIVDRLLQFRHEFVIVVADHQRDTFLRVGRRGWRQ